MKPYRIIFITLISLILITQLHCEEDEDEIYIQGIEPNGGLTKGETRVLVRLRNFNKDLISSYPHPKCRFGSKEYTVDATFTKCTPKPRKVGERQPTTAEKTEVCVQCEDSPEHADDIVPFTVSFVGDFSDVTNSVSYRFYDEPKVIWISPRYGPKDGNTKVDVFGEGFLNFDQNLRCGFGSTEVKGIFVSANHIQCFSPFSAVVEREIPFSISLNNQQNTKDDIEYVYYDNPSIYKIEPTNRGPDTGGSVIRLRGQNFNPLVALKMNNDNETFCQFSSLGYSVAKVLSSTEVECVTPPSYDLSQTPVEVTLNNQDWTDDGVLFYYYHPPYTYYINPKIGPVTGGTLVHVIGGNFEDTGTVKCKFGDKFGEGKFVSSNELQCISPPVEKPATVPLYVATREDEFSSGLNTQFTYYANPVIHFIEPACGPQTGYTQITVYGENFPVGYSNNVKCLFNGEIKTNVTIMNYTIIKCDSPPMTAIPKKDDNGAPYYTLELIVNDDDESGPAQKFYYYNSPLISAITPIMGGVEGDTTVKISGTGFNQSGACNITARFATYHTKPLDVQNNYLLVKSPEANYTGSVVVQVALNGQQFEKDITVHFRDRQNTFYYYKCPVVTSIYPEEGPSAGGNDINLYGIGFLEPYLSLDKENNLKMNLYDGDIKEVIYYRFVDANDGETTYGDVQSISIEDGTTQKITLKSPSVKDSKKYKGERVKTTIQLSYDGEIFCDYDDIVYTFFNLPNILSISPKYANLNKEGQGDTITVTLDNLNCTQADCSKGIKCRFKATEKDSLKEFETDGKYLEQNKLSCNTPNVNVPEEFVVEISTNGGKDYTNNGHTFAFYDPFVLKVEPQMLSSKGNTEITITGYGFADTNEVKALFGDSDKSSYLCGGSKCVVDADYIDKNTIKTVSKPKREIKENAGAEIKNFDRIPVEVAIHDNDFTNNKVTVFYYDEPEIVQDVDSEKGKTLGLSNKEKSELKNALVHSIPCNLDTFIPIPVDGTNIEKHLDSIQDFTNYTCLFEVNGKEKITNGVYTKFPLNNTKHNLFLCQSPQFVNEVNDSSLIRISLNGYDFSDDYFSIAFTDPVNIYKVNPACGPIEGGTEVNIYGTGFQDTKKAVFKWGPQNIVPMNSKTLLDKIDTETSQEVLYGMQQFVALTNPEDDEEREKVLEELQDVEINKIVVTAPPAPNDNIKLKTRGGLDYISVSKTNLLPLDDFLKQYYANNYIHTNFEYYYYRQIYIESFHPAGSISTGGAKVMVIGAWFQNKPQYGLRPYCRFGDKVVEGEFLSTVRIVCEAPPSDKEFTKVPFYVSLNGEDWVEAKKRFKYYGDFKNAKFDRIEPMTGPTSGGTNIKIYGSGFSSMFDDTEFRCQFEPVVKRVYIDEKGNKVVKEEKANMEPRNVPATLSKEVHDEDNEDQEETYIECNTPGGWPAGSRTNVKIAFDGQTFLDTGKDFYFYKIDEVTPCSGPNTGEGTLSFLGGGFQDNGNVTFVMNGVSYKPLEVTEEEIKCDIPEMQNNFTGYVDLGLYLNGLDEFKYKDGFYYYVQPTIESVYPLTGPSSGSPVFHVYGKGFKDDFRCSNLACKIGNVIGEGELISDSKMRCNFTHLPVEQAEYTEKEDGTKVRSTHPISVALNGVSFTKENPEFAISSYSLEEITPVSGPIETGTTIVVKGSGFTDSDNIRCRFGVPGYFAYTEGKYIDYNRISCPSPQNFEIPNGGQLPFTVPFSIAFNDDEFNPWTQTSHVFTFYKTPDVAVVTPNEMNTTTIMPVYLKADVEEQQLFSVPSASIKEEEYLILNKDGEAKRGVRKSVKYQPITCKFDKYGITEAEYINRTDINCLTPNFADDGDIVYEEIPIELAPNGVDYIEAGKINLKGQQAKTVGCMYCVLAILGVLFLAALAALIAWMCSKNMLGMGDVLNEPHTENKKLKYLNENYNVGEKN